MTEGAREPRGAGGDVGAAHAERRGAGMEGGACDIEDRQPGDTGPHVWMAQPRATNAGSESQVEIFNDSSPLGMEEGQEGSKDGQRQGTQQRPLPGQAEGSERGATETLGTAKAPSQTTSGARSQAIHRKVFHVGIQLPCPLLRAILFFKFSPASAFSRPTNANMRFSS
jgi:hypothetical protein